MQNQRDPLPKTSRIERSLQNYWPQKQIPKADYFVHLYSRLCLGICDQFQGVRFQILRFPLPCSNPIWNEVTHIHTVHQKQLQLCKKNLTLSKRYVACTEQKACRDFADSFIVAEPKFKSATFQFQLYCEREWYKSVVFNLSDLGGPLMATLLLILADRFGRKVILQIVGPIGMVAASIGLVFDNLAALTLSMLVMNCLFGTIFSLSFVYFNEMVIDPWRSRCSGFKSLAITLGNLGRGVSSNPSLLVAVYLGQRVQGLDSDAAHSVGSCLTDFF